MEKRPHKEYLEKLVMDAALKSQKIVHEATSFMETLLNDFAPLSTPRNIIKSPLANIERRREDLEIKKQAALERINSGIRSVFRDMNELENDMIRMIKRDGLYSDNPDGAKKIALLDEAISRHETASRLDIGMEHFVKFITIFMERRALEDAAGIKWQGEKNLVMAKHSLGEDQDKFFNEIKRVDALFHEESAKAREMNPAKEFDTGMGSPFMLAWMMVHKDGLGALSQSKMISQPVYSPKPAPAPIQTPETPKSPQQRFSEAMENGDKLGAADAMREIAPSAFEKRESINNPGVSLVTTNNPIATEFKILPSGFVVMGQILSDERYARNMGWGGGTEWEWKSGAKVINPQTGEVVAEASTPSFQVRDAYDPKADKFRDIPKESFTEIGNDGSVSVRLGRHSSAQISQKEIDAAIASAAKKR